MRKVAIVGTAPSSWELAPYDDPEWEIWGTSRLYHTIPRWDVWFELHVLDSIGKGWDMPEAERKQARAKHMEWLANQVHPIYLQEEDERVPSGIRYPLEEVLEHLEGLSGASGRYLTNHIAYMLALAIYEQVDEIGIWGVDMALDSEYAYQRPSCEYLIGLARGAGIPVFVPDESDLLTSWHLYGYEDDSPMHRRMRARKKELAARKNKWAQKKDVLLQKRAAYVGQLELIEAICANGADPAFKQELQAHGEQVAAEARRLEEEIDGVKQGIASFNGALESLEYLNRSLM